MGITKEQFVVTYRKMQAEGKTALEIANALGVDKPTDEAKSQFISQKASNYRKALRAEALERAQQDGLDEKATSALVRSAENMLPTLTKRTTEGAKSNLDWFKDLIARETGESQESGDSDSEEKTEETPE